MIDNKVAFTPAEEVKGFGDHEVAETMKALFECEKQETVMSPKSAAPEGYFTTSIKDALKMAGGIAAGVQQKVMTKADEMGVKKTMEDALKKGQDMAATAQAKVMEKAKEAGVTDAIASAGAMAKSAGETVAVKAKEAGVTDAIANAGAMAKSAGETVVAKAKETGEAAGEMAKRAQAKVKATVASTNSKKEEDLSL